ncbi:hypothetical protein DSUL_80057 [Desulfovibrionales bacterium]
MWMRSRFTPPQTTAIIVLAIKDCALSQTKNEPLALIYSNINQQPFWYINSWAGRPYP